MIIGIVVVMITGIPVVMTTTIAWIARASRARLGEKFSEVVGVARRNR